MISDDSSSDSETGRFKGTLQKKDDVPRHDLKQRHNSVRQSYNKSSDDRRFNRDFNRRDDRHRSRFSRQSPDHKRRLSRDRSSERRRRSIDRHPRHDHMSSSYSRRDSRRSTSREKRRGTPSRSRRSTEFKRSIKDEKASVDVVKVLSLEETNKKTERNISPIDLKKSKSQVVLPSPEARKRKSTSPIIDENVNNEVLPGSYYNMIPVVKEASEKSSVTDSSDDERLRAKLLNLEKELDKTRKKKHKKKHRRRTSKSKTKERDRDGSNTVEVTSTTDIKETKKTNNDDNLLEIETAEVSSSQLKPNKRESSEEGEIVSDEDDTKKEDISPTDLRHKLKRSTIRESSKSPDLREKLKLKDDVCGPALPPHLESKYKKTSLSPGSSKIKGW